MNRVDLARRVRRSCATLVRYGALVVADKRATAGHRAEVSLQEVKVRPARGDERRRWDTLAAAHDLSEQFMELGLRHIAVCAGAGWRWWAGSLARSTACHGTAGWAGTVRCNAGVCI